MTEISAGAQEGANGRSVPYVNGKQSYAEKFNIADHFIGGNRLANAPPSKVKDFVGQNDGHTVITNVRKFPLEQDSTDFRQPRQSDLLVAAQLTQSFDRSSLPTTVSLPLRRFDQSENGLTRRLATSEPFTSL
ncbi:hypothetical protein EDB82DRAFT_503104 [Fusarium venenatum]|uniref:uncharacterized protein n=1 Tax=Fusarium venenatum TaxID=56646 RepID=UPI001D34BA68|nr:hypothetical protein EDB82DRAFT_503104 [Fusarium venenatum]